MRKLFLKNVKSFSKDEKGATMVEYGILVALIAAVCIGIITTTGTNLQTLFTTVSGRISTANDAATGTTGTAK